MRTSRIFPWNDKMNFVFYKIQSILWSGLYLSLSTSSLLSLTPCTLHQSKCNYSSWKHQAAFLVLFVMHGGSLFSFTTSLVTTYALNDMLTFLTMTTTLLNKQICKLSNSSPVSPPVEVFLLIAAFPPQEEAYPLYPIQILSWCLHQFPILNLFSYLSWPANWEFLSGKNALYSLN